MRVDAANACYQVCTQMPRASNETRVHAHFQVGQRLKIEYNLSHHYHAPCQCYLFGLSCLLSEEDSSLFPPRYHDFEDTLGNNLVDMVALL